MIGWFGEKLGLREQNVLFCLSTASEWKGNLLKHMQDCILCHKDLNTIETLTIVFIQLKLSLNGILSKGSWLQRNSTAFLFRQEK